MRASFRLSCKILYMHGIKPTGLNNNVVMLATMIYYIAFLDRPNEPHEKWSRLLLAATLQLTLCLSTNDSHYEVVISSDLCFYQIVNEPGLPVALSPSSFRRTMINRLAQNLAVLGLLLSSKRT